MITNSKIEQLREYIKELVVYYLSKFPKFNFTPKFHLLFKHVLTFTHKRCLGLGVMGEQEGEQLHAQFNKLHRRLIRVKNTKGVPPELALLRAVMEEHLIQVYPSNRKGKWEE